MDKSIQYTQIMSNFDSGYNVVPNFIHHSTNYVPKSYENRSISPSLRSSTSKFNFDLYKPNESHSESSDYYSSPSSSVIIHHHPQSIYSPPPSQSISKLRQINDELCQTLAQCELTTQLQPSPSPPLSNYHIHHYPIPSKSYRSRSPSLSSIEQDSSSTDSEPITKKRNARITYKAHIPRRQRPDSLSKIDQLLISTSNAYSQNDPMTVDFYPTRDQGFVKNIRNRPDNQSPWLVDTSPIRRNSYSEASTYRTPRAPYYEDELLQPKSRLATGKVRPRSASLKPRFRPDSAPNRLRKSATTSSSNIGPVWRPNGTIKHPKFMGSNAPPTKPKPLPREPAWNPTGIATKTKKLRAFDPVSKPLPPKAQEPVWNPPSKNYHKKPPKYFEPTLKPELTEPIQTQTEPVLRKKSIKNQTIVRSTDPKLKKRIATAESKVKSAWEPTTTTVKESKPPTVPRPIQKPTTKTTTIPPKPKVKSIPSQPTTVPIKKINPTPSTKIDTGRSSLNDVPTKPMFQSTPRNQSIVADEDNVDDLFENESEIIESPKKPVIPHPPPQIEKTPPKLPQTSVPEPDKGTKTTIKDGVLIHGDDEDDRATSPMSEVNNNDEEKEEQRKPSPIPPKRKTPSSKPDNRDDVSVVDDEDIHQPNEDIEQSFGVNRSVDNAAKDTSEIVSPLTPKADIKTPPRRKESSFQFESPDQSPIASKKKQEKLPSTPIPPAPTTTNDNVDDFFD